MAVLRQDLLRSTFQEKQIDLLESLDKNMSRTTDASVASARFLEDRLLQRLDMMFDNLSISINNKSGYDTALEGLTRVFRDTSERTNRSEGTRHRESVSLWTRFIGDQQKSLNRLQHTISAFNKSIGFSLDAVIANTDQFSAFYNTTIKNTGMSGTAAQDFRSDLLDIVKELNQQYRNEFGGAFNANESLQVLATVVNSGVRNPEYYQEFGDELLEANAAMNINLATLAKFSDKFYRRYNFSSESMESLLNNINENVATTSVSEEDLIRQIEENEFVVAQWLTQREGLTAGTAEFERRQSEINNSLNDTLAYATEVGLENTLSTILKAIEGGQTTSEAMMLLQTTGMNVEALTQGYMTDATDLLYTVAERMENNGLVQSYANSSYRSEWAKATGFDESILKEVILATEMTPEEFEQLKAERATTESLEEKVEDIYVSTEDRFANDLLDKYGDNLAKIQEDTGLSMTFLETIANTVIGIAGLLASYIGSETLGSIFGRGGSSGSLVKGLLSKFGPALGIGAAVAGVALSAWNIEKRVSEQYEQSSLNAEETVGEVGETLSLNEGDYGYITPTNDAGVMDYDYTATDIETDPEVPDLSLKDFMDTWYDSYESKTGNMYNPDARITEDFGGWLGTFAQNFGRNIIGPGWWKDNSTGWDKIPIISGLAQSLINGYHEFSGDNYQERLEATALSNLNIYSNTVGPTAMKAMLRYWESIGTLDKLTPVYIIDYDTEVQDLISQGYIPKKVSEDGVEGKVSFDEMGDYSEYLYSYQRGEIPYYEQGTNYVPHDQLAYLHEGEAVTPAEYNPAANINELERLKSQEAEVQEGTLTSLKEVASAVKAIQDFLEFWRQDNIDREAIASVKATTSSVNSNLLSLQGYGSY